MHSAVPHQSVEPPSMQSLSPAPLRRQKALRTPIDQSKTGSAPCQPSSSVHALLSAATGVNARSTQESQFVGLQPWRQWWLRRTSYAATGKTESAAHVVTIERIPPVKYKSDQSGHGTQGLGGAALPNPSLKLSANGMSRWPSSAGPAAHFALAVQRATPLAPA